MPRLSLPPNLRLHADETILGIARHHRRVYFAIANGLYRVSRVSRNFRQPRRTSLLAMNESERTLAIVTEVFAAFDDHDLDRFWALLADDAVLNVGGGEQTFRGAEAVVAAVRGTLEAIPDLRVTVTNAFASGPNGVAEVVREGTHGGPVSLPNGTEVPPSGRAVRLPECAVFEVREGQVVRMVVYADQLDTARQLGMLPEEDAA